MQDSLLLSFVLNISAAAALLIWAVRLVRTGVERAFSNQLRRWLRLSSGNRLFAALSGLSAAVFLQSSTAVAMLVADFVAKSGLSVVVGLAMLLGADVGSALVTQLLLLREAWLIPALILLGAVLFFKGSNAATRQVGRIFIGLALIFMSLDMIGAATAQVVDSPATQTAVAYLGRDLVSAFLVGALFTWAIHSSVAAVLLIVTLTGQSVLPLEGAAAMVLGANLGGAMIAYVLTLAAPVAGRQVVVANALLRGAGAAAALYALQLYPELLQELGKTSVQQTINLHLAFNTVLLIVALPFVSLVVSLISKFIHERTVKTALDEISALDENALDTPVRALQCSAFELLQMGQKAEHMLRIITPLYDKWDIDSAQAIARQDKIIKSMHLDLKLYLARLGQGVLDEEQSRRAMDLASIASGLVSASDVMNRSMLNLAKRLDSKGLTFSPKGREEIQSFSDRVLSNVQLALSVMMNQSPAEARELVAAKERVRAVEQKLQRSHLGRLREGQVESIETSNIHQETLRSLKQVNTAFSMVGYPILSKNGGLLDSQLTAETVS